MSTKSIILVIVGAIILGLVVFFSMRQNTEAPTVPSVPGAPSVTIDSYKFKPNTLTVKKGTTVTWTNNDSAPHTVTSDNRNAGPASSSFGKGQTYAYTFDTVGTYSYHCGIHPSMAGSVVVTE